MESLQSIPFPTHEEVVLPYRFVLAYRDVGGDHGYAIHVFGPVNGVQEEILRFDCFEETPHYHLGWSYRNDPFIKIEAADPLDWTIQALESSFEEFLHQAGGDIILSSDFSEQLSKALEQIRRKSIENRI